ncbi:ubiquitin-40S ribosomal protein S27a-like [Mercurialis annua]|uniref:ubiquitin-40S ribosomal protein S27a-like n=1 Tax=Mercurialis annua TaxID=3986 RepID=UPI00216034EA|nr:ubiquitin-40S ribosomal protein S27a-like [Mercurialis annua]
MQILIKIPAEQTLTLEVTPTDTITNLKSKIEAKKRIPPAQQRLVFATAQLEDDKTLSHYNIKDDSLLHVLLRLCGGAKKRKKKVFTTPKKEKHEKEKEKLGVLKMYKVDDESGQVEKLRAECPKCGPGNFMANHVDRDCCGKCGFTSFFSHQVDDSAVAARI